MDFSSWEPTYQDILDDFRFRREDDEEAATELAHRLGSARFQVDQEWTRLVSIFRGQPTTILGAADDAADRLLATSATKRLIAADGATTAALEVGRRPDLIVSDLDGSISDEVEAVGRGASIAVHAHGDNLVAIRRWLDEFAPQRVVGTCQSRPIAPLRNYGGFTDGDRACHLAAALGASDLLLAGFAFEGPVGKYAGAYDPVTKPRKLVWAKRLIDALSASGVTIRYA